MPLQRPNAHRAVTLLVTAAITTGSIALTAPAIASAAPAGCPTTFNLFIPGTWETEEGADPSVSIGMLKPIADSLADKHGSAAQIYTLPYMARAFDNGKTYADSKSDGLSKAKAVLTEIAAKCSDTKFTITGYSQGADIAGRSRIRNRQRLRPHHGRASPRGRAPRGSRFRNERRSSCRSEAVRKGDRRPSATGHGEAFRARRVDLRSERPLLLDPEGLESTAWIAGFSALQSPEWWR